MQKYIPALKYHFITSYYDSIIKILVPEKRIREEVLNMLPIKGDENVLDFGFGTGTFILMLKKRFPNLKIHGIDVDEKIIEIAKKKFIKNQIEITFHNDFSTLNQKFEIIYSTWVFHHLNRKEKLISFKEIYTNLKPNGTFLLADWGKPHNLLMKIAFFILQLFDNFTTTADHKDGLIPSMIIDVGFKKIKTINIISTPLGSLYIWQITK